MTAFVLLIALLLAPEEQVSSDETRVHELATRIADTMTARDPSVYDALVDVDAILDKATEGIDASEDAKRGFRSGFKETGGKFGSQFLQGFADGASYRLLRVYTEGGRTHAIFRLLTGGAVNYHDVEFQQTKGSLRVVDLFAFTTGETVTQTVRRMYAAVTAEADQGLIDRLFGAEREFLKNLPNLKKMQQQIAAGEHARALETYAAMTDGFRNEKVVQTLRLQAAMTGPEAEYAKVIAEYAALFPGDPSLDLYLIDGYFLQKKWVEVFGALDRIERRVGADAWIDVLRGNMSFAKDDEAAARKFFRAAILREPTLQEPYWALVEIALQKERFDEIAELLIEIERALGLDLTGVETADGYAKFRASEAYKKWQAARAK